MKNYIVSYTIKKNCREYGESMTVTAPNAKEAARLCKLAVKEKTGRNAFRPVAKAL